YAGVMVLTLAAEVYLPFRDIGSAYHASEDGIEALNRAKAQIQQPIPNTLAKTLDTSNVFETGLEIQELTIAYKALHRTEEKTPTGPEYLTPKQWEQAKHDQRSEPQKQSSYLPNYQQEILSPVVHNFSLSLEPHQYTVLGDASGTGKSTILKALAGVVTEAEAKFSGSVRGLASRPVAYLPQHPAFLSETVEEELSTVIYSTAQEFLQHDTPSEVDQLVDTALNWAGIQNYGSRHIDNLSPGERRRLGFARVLARLMAAAQIQADTPAWLVVLDEPTAHLDNTSAAKIRQVLRDLARGRLPNGATL